MGYFSRLDLAIKENYLSPRSQMEWAISEAIILKLPTTWLAAE